MTMILEEEEDVARLNKLNRIREYKMKSIIKDLNEMKTRIIQ